MTPGLRRALFGVVIAAVCLDTVVYGLVVPMLPRLGAALGFGQTGAGILLGSYAAGLFVAIPLIGLAVRRWGYRLPLLGGIAGLALSLVIFLLADAFSGMVAARTLQGAASGATWTAGLTVIADQAPARRRGAAMGLVMTAFAAGLMAGPPLGGLVSDRLGITAAFAGPAALGAALTAIAAVVLVRAGPGPVQPARPLRPLITDPGITGLAAVVAAVAAVMGLLEPTLPLALEARFGTSGAVIGLLFGLIALAFGLASPFAGHSADRNGAVTTIRRGAAPLVVVLPLFAVAPGPGWTAPLFAATGVLCALALGPTLPGLAARVDQHDGQSYAVAYALFNMAFAVGLFAGPVAGAAAAATLGLPATLLAAAALIAAGLPLLRRLAWLETRPQGFTKQ